MAEVITRLKLESTQYDSKLRDTAKSLAEITRVATNAGRAFGEATQKDVEFAKSLGTIAVSATNNKDKVKELVGAYNDVFKAYDALTKQQQDSDFGKAMAESLVQLKERIREAKQDLYGLSEASEKVKATSSSLFGEGGLTGMMAVTGGNLLAQGITKMGSEITDTIQQSIELAKAGEGIRVAFDRLNRPDLLDKLKEATHGTVSELELMKQAVKFNDFRLNLDEMGTLLAFAQQKAKDTGQSVDYMVDSIVTGLGRQSLMILDNLGLSASQIKEEMAKTGDMTTAVANIIKDQMSQAGEYVETAADRAARAAADASNQMEDLGRKAMPVAEQWAQSWATIKMGALDLLNNAVTPLINALTVAGQMRSAMNKRGSSERVARQISWLGNPGEEGKQSVYDRIESDYVDQINHARSEYNKLRKDAIWNPFAAWKADKALGELNAIKQEYANFKEQAKQIMNPITTKVTVDTKDATRDVNSLKQKLKELQAQRRQAIKEGDTSKSKDLLKQINQTKADIRGLDPNALKSGSGGTNPQKQAADRVANAMHSYEQEIEKARMQLENGTKTELDYKKQLLSAQERLWDAYGDAYNTYKDPKYKQAQDECAAKIKALGGEVTASVKVQKEQQQAARELAATQKKVSDAMAEAQTAYQNNDLRGYLASMKKAGADASQGMTSDGFTLTTSNLDAFIGNLKEKVSQSDVGTELYNKLTSQLADANALSSVIEFAVQNGLDTANINPQELFKKIFSEDADIPDDFWKKLSSGMGKQAGKKFEIDTKTGKRKDGKEGKDGKDKDFVDVAGKLNSGITSMVGSLEQMGVDIPEGFKGVLGGISGAIGVLQSIMVIVEAIEAMQTVGTFLGIFHKGGVVRAAGGVSIVPGNRPSGDTVPALLESGEVVLSRSQGNNLS
jgi:hypothetical protein